MNRNPPTSWLRIPELWLVAGIPALTILAGVATVILASASGSADAVILPVERTGPIQVLRDAADRRAAELKLRARVMLDRERHLLTAELSAPLSEPLTLTLAHPVRRSLDRRVVLTPLGAGRYRAVLSLPPAHHWNLVLAARDGSWRLGGRLHPSVGEAWLSAALVPP